MSEGILVTGGSGFIGTHLVKALLRAGASVVNADIKPPILPEHFALWRPCDLRDRASVEELIADIRPKIVINLAAHATLTGTVEAMAVNTEGCVNLLASSADLDPRPFIIHTSTQLVVRPGYTPSGELDFAPYSKYGETKAASERIFHASGARNWAIFRPTNVWGPYHPTFANAIWAYISKRYYMHPSGRDPVRSYGYVGNVVSQYVTATKIEQSRIAGKTLYVGDEPIPSSVWLDAFSMALTGKPVRRVPMAILMGASLAGELSKLIGGPSPINFGRLYRITTDYRVPMEPTLQLLGAGPTSLVAGVEKTVRWLKDRKITEGHSNVILGNAQM